MTHRNQTSDKRHVRAGDSSPYGQSATSNRRSSREASTKPDAASRPDAAHRFGPSLWTIHGGTSSSRASRSAGRAPSHSSGFPSSTAWPLPFPPLFAALGVAALLVLALIAAVGFGCGAHRTAPVATVGADEPSGPDWSGLTWENGFPYFEVDSQAASELGIDVSDHQGWIDWYAVAQQGFQFAYVRTGSRGYTEGALIADEYCAANLDGAAAAGLDVGAYFFSQAVTPEEAREEARFVLDQLGGRTLSLPVAFDHETVEDANGRANRLSRADLTACAQAFCEVIEAAGYSTIIYGNAYDLARLNLAELGDRPVWLAEYGVSAPSSPLAIAMWQYTNAGTIAGVDTPVDLNIRFTATP